MIDDILGQIVKGVRSAIEAGHYRVEASEATGAAPSLKEAVLAAAPEAFLAEVKPASPSTGPLARGDPEETARRMLRHYADYGVTGISVLTERDRFGGSLALLRDAVRLAPRRPVLMKDFIIADAQLDAAQAAGASAVLFIHHLFARGQTTWELPDAITAAHERSLEVLLEVDSHQGLDHALTTDADLIGVNNRDLRTLELDLDRTGDLLRFRMQRLGKRPVLALSGIRDRDDVVTMRRGGASGVLVGTTLMAAPDVPAALRGLRGLAHVKVCGAGHAEDTPEVVRALAAADAVGCVVGAGGARRERTLEEAAHLFAALPADQEHVLVTTETDPDTLAERIDAAHATALQIHAEPAVETVEAIRERLADGTILIALLRAPEGTEVPGPEASSDGFETLLARGRTIARYVDRILLDVPPLPGEDAGGTGRTIDRALARHLVASLAPARVVLAGGLHAENVAATLRAVRPYGVDISSGAEGATVGKKDAERIRRLIRAARSVPGLFDNTEEGPALGQPLIRDVQWRDPTFPSAP